MTGIYIDGIGGISGCACTAEEFSALADGKEYTAQGRMTEFVSTVPTGKLRRCSRYTKLAASAADLALRDGSPIEGIDPHRIGVVVSSDFGACEYSRQFADQVVRHEPPACSPVIFSQTVPNSCVGQICIINGFKGAGTMLRGGDPLEYAALLLKLGKADIMLCGQAEEWSDELYASFNGRNAAEGCVFSEGAAFAVLRPFRTERTCCEIAGFASVNIGFSPLLEQNTEMSDTIAAALSDLNTDGADLIFSAGNGTWFDETERKALSAVSGMIPCITPKSVFGETLGSAFMLSVVLAAAALRKGSYKGTKCSSVIVTGFDAVGNYHAVRLIR